MLRKVAGLGLLVATVAVGCGDDGGSEKDATNAQVTVDSGARDASTAKDGSAIVVEMRPDAGPPLPGQCTPNAGPELDDLIANKTAVKLLPFQAGRKQFTYDGDLYYVESGVGLQRIKKTSTQPETVFARAQPKSFSAAIVDNYIYYVDSDTAPLARVPLNNPTATPELQVGTPRGRARIMHGDDFYGYDDVSDATHQLWKQNFKTGQVQILATVKEEFGGLDVADGFAYFTDTTFGVEQLFRVSTSGGQPQRLTDGSFVRLQAVKVVGGNVYWADGYRLYVTEIGATDRKAGTQPFGNYSPPTGITASTNGTRDGYGLTEIGDRIYWVDDNNTVGWTSKDRATCGAVVTAGVFEDVLGYGAGFIYTSGSREGVVRIPIN